MTANRALISVWDKTGVVEFAGRLVGAGFELVASGGSAAALEAAGIGVTAVEAVTGVAEMLDGRVKTLHPAIHAGILADPTDLQHLADLERHGISPVQLVVANLSPFEEVAGGGGSDAEVIDALDIGGPAMIRAAAKNHAHVAVVVDPSQYGAVAAAVESGRLDASQRRELAREAFYCTARYDAAILEWLSRDERFSQRLVVPLTKVVEPRYGENPHQPSALYRQEGGVGSWFAATQVQGRDLSFNNYLDAEAAWRMVAGFDAAAAVVVKHGNPTGLATGPDAVSAFGAAWEADPQAAFGGVVAVNRVLDRVLAKSIAGAGFVEVVVVPSVASDAVAELAGRPNLRVLAAPFPDPADPDFRRIDGGFLVQERDGRSGNEDPKVVSQAQPTEAQWAALDFALAVVAHVKSNGVVIVRDGATVGIGAGDQSRVGAARRAAAQAGDRARDAVAAGDAFFPFRDGLDVLANAGVTAIITPGGSRRDDEVVAAADEHGIALVFTTRRHFRH